MGDSDKARRLRAVAIQRAQVVLAFVLGGVLTVTALWVYAMATFLDGMVFVQ